MTILFGPILAAAAAAAAAGEGDRAHLDDEDVEE